MEKSVYIIKLSAGTIDISFMDPVVIGRNVFKVTNETVGGAVGYIQDVLCAIIDTVLDTVKGIWFMCGLFVFFDICVEFKFKCVTVKVKN